MADEHEPREQRSDPRRPAAGSRSSSSRSGKPYPKRDGDKKPYAKRDGDKKPYPKRDGDKKPYPKRDGDKKPYAKRESDSRDKRPPRDEDLRSVRPRHDDPVIPDDVTARDLHPNARNELKTLSKDNADGVARHLAMAAALIDEDPELAHRHALSASRRAGRIAIVRETLAITAYATGDYALALRELRTYRRISGRDDQIALMVDSERGVGRPDRALEVGRAVDRASLPVGVRVELAIAMSGARLDLEQPDRALLELEIPELDPDRAFEWSPGLFAARATVLEELGRDDEAQEWHRRALVAAAALDDANDDSDWEFVVVEEVLEEHEEDPEPEEDQGAEAAPDDADVSDDSASAPEEPA